MARSELNKNHGAAGVEFVLLKAEGLWAASVAVGGSRAEQCVAADRRVNAPPAERER